MTKLLANFKDVFYYNKWYISAIVDGIELLSEITIVLACVLIELSLSIMGEL